MYTKESVEKTDGIAFPGKSFQDCVLEPVFNVQKEYYYRPFIEISKAHILMLQEQNIISREEARTLMKGLLQVETLDFDSRKYDPDFEDMFFMVENELARQVGADVAGRMHIARSRNDLDICEFRMALRTKVLDFMSLLNSFKEVLLHLSEEHVETIMPAYTHTQPAQPTTLAHYFLAFYDAAERSYRRMESLYKNINRSPIGACAITTTCFPINRERMRELLGFEQLIENSYDCIAGCDYLTECAAVFMILNTDLSKFLNDILSYCTKEFNVFYLSDPYVQTSSIMPQKRNPSSLEHTRPIISKAIGEAHCVFTILHNTPFGDIVDAEEDLQPHLYEMISCSTRVLRILCSVLVTMKVNKDVLFKRAHEGFITATELADTLVRLEGLSFRLSHMVTSRIVAYLTQRDLGNEAITPELIDRIAEETIGKKIKISHKEIQQALDPVHFVEIRKITGGPSPVEVKRMLADRRKALKDDFAAYEGQADRLKNAESLLNGAIDNLLA